MTQQQPKMRMEIHIYEWIRWWSGYPWGVSYSIFIEHHLTSLLSQTLTLLLFRLIIWNRLILQLIEERGTFEQGWRRRSRDVRSERFNIHDGNQGDKDGEKYKTSHIEKVEGKKLFPVSEYYKEEQQQYYICTYLVSIKLSNPTCHVRPVVRSVSHQKKMNSNSSKILQKSCVLWWAK